WSREVLRSNVPVELLSPDEGRAYTLAVADGMGGQAFGELASLLSLRTLWDLSRSQVKIDAQLNDVGAEAMSEKIRAFARLIHRALVEQGRLGPKLAGMGTTMAVAHTIGPEALIAHVGDSRVYLLRGGALTRLTRDHTLEEALVEAGRAAPGS